MSAGKIDELMELMDATLAHHDDRAPFANHRELYKKIDEIGLGHVPWQSFTASYNGELPANPPDWMSKSYSVYYRDPREVIHTILSNPDFKDEIDYAPFREFGDGKRRWSDFMSGDWCWKQAVSNLFNIFRYIFAKNSPGQDNF